MGEVGNYRRQKAEIHFLFQEPKEKKKLLNLSKKFFSEK